MKFIASILLIALLSFIAGLLLPWWTIAVVAAGVSLALRQSPGRSFLAGFLGIFALWSSLSWWIDAANEGLLSGKIAQLFQLGYHGWPLILVTGLVGGLVGGMAALTASYAASKKQS